MRSAFRVPEISLRLRLLLALIALSAAGLLTLAIVSHRALESFLFDRVDQQAEAAVGRAAFLLHAPPGRPQLPVPPPDGGPGPQLPPGTFAGLRDANGEVVRGFTFSYGESGLPRPDLGSVPLSHLTGDLDVTTVGARRGSGEFRAIALAEPTGSRSIVVAVPLSDVQDTLHRLAVIEGIVTAVVLLALAALAWWVIRLGLRPLERIGETAGEIAAGNLSRRVETANPGTEVGRLGMALNAMLGQIEEAFAQRQASEDRMRRFLADASHELRTPLSSIRGYAELFRLGVADEPEELEKAMRRIEQEAERMGVLVDDLLTLARLDEVREPVREPFDLAQVVGDACADARAAYPDRQVSLVAPRSIEILGDADQIRQVAANLLRNAAVHTPAGTSIEALIESDAAEAVLRVRDHGPGLPPGAGDQVFERFWRQSESRRRDGGGGAGLGLAIVASIVAAHGGEVHAENADDGGAIFTASFPLPVTALPRGRQGPGRASGQR